MEQDKPRFVQLGIVNPCQNYLCCFIFLETVQEVPLEIRPLRIDYSCLRLWNYISIQSTCVRMSRYRSHAAWAKKPRAKVWLKKVEKTDWLRRITLTKTSPWHCCRCTRNVLHSKWILSRKPSAQHEGPFAKDSTRLFLMARPKSPFVELHFYSAKICSEVTLSLAHWLLVLVNDKEDVGDNGISPEPAVVFASESQRTLALLQPSDSYNPPSGKRRK